MPASAAATGGIVRCMTVGRAQERDLQVVIYREGDGFAAQCLNVDVASQGATEAEARANILEALQLYFEEPAAREDYQPVGDAHVEQFVRLATDRYATPEPRPPLPSYVGVGASGRSDIAEGADEMLDGFGR
jgi:predicted RNase H-like HicB family nuclease